MKQSAFIKIVADAYGVEEKTVTLFARLMREAGLLTTGSRGVNAPHMHPRDAVRLTIALLATSTAAHAPKMYQRFAGMTVQADRSNGPHPVSLGIVEGATLESVLLHMFMADMFPGNVEGGGPFECNPYLELQENQRIATIEHSVFVDGKYVHDASKPGKLFFKTSNSTDDVAHEDRRAHAGIFTSRGVAPIALMSCALPFYLERKRKLSWETLLAEAEAEAEKMGQSIEGNFLPEKGLWFDRDLEGSK